jgi:2-dehydro-3-deoxy-D-arabinonate dehydratase
MAIGLFRLELPDGTVQLARGDPRSGPTELLDGRLTVGAVLAEGWDGLARAVDAAPGRRPVPAGARIMAPVDEQEVWAAGVTYERSKHARMEESDQASVYDHVYDAERPELFFKAAGWRVRGPGQSIGVRRDSAWNVPEPELGLVIAADLRIAGYTIGNDVSSRTIEGENPLYLPQAKVYDRSCALGPALVPVASAAPPFDVSLTIARDGSAAFEGTTTTGRIRRPLDSLVEFLGRAMAFPHGAILLTGTGIVPDTPFSLLPGDIVRIAIPPLGVLDNAVEAVGEGPPV